MAERKDVLPRGIRPNPRFTIVIPPPNVTGKLHLVTHMGYHASGSDHPAQTDARDDALYLPGMDHAGIATQAKVTRNSGPKRSAVMIWVGRNILKSRGAGKESMRL